MHNNELLSVLNQIPVGITVTDLDEIIIVSVPRRDL